MKLKTGKLRKDLVPGIRYGNAYFFQAMKKNGIVNIVKNVDDLYTIENCNYLYSEEMFESKPSLSIFHGSVSVFIVLLGTLAVIFSMVRFLINPSISNLILTIVLAIILGIFLVLESRNNEL